MSASTFLNLTPAQRDAAYDNTAAVANSAEQLRAFERRSASVAVRSDALLDQAYGVAERQTFDFFAGQEGTDTVLFIHGGYWQMRHKNTFRFVVEGALAQGCSAALIGYTLAPQANLTAIVAQVHAGIRAVSEHAKNQGRSGKIRLCGWSAGGHLTAMSMQLPEVVVGLGISGIYDLAPIRHTYLNAALQLSDEEVQTLSPLGLGLGGGKRFITAYGTAELPALQAQSLQFAVHNRSHNRSSLLAVPDAEHFSILNALAAPDGALLQALLRG